MLALAFGHLTLGRCPVPYPLNTVPRGASRLERAPNGIGLVSCVCASQSSAAVQSIPVLGKAAAQLLERASIYGITRARAETAWPGKREEIDFGGSKDVLKLTA